MAPCDCTFHRYDVVHICSCRRIISHSQGDWDTHKFHGIGFTVPSRLFQHSDKVNDLIEWAVEAGIASR